MIGTIRKHSAWLWVLIIAATIISFVWWGTTPATRNGAGGRNAGFGVIYGREVTREDYIAAKAEFFIYYWIRNGEWPSRSKEMTEAEMEREIYWRILLTRKAADLGIHTGDAEVQKAAENLMLSIGRNKQVIPISEFVDKILVPQGLNAADLKRALTGNIAIQQLVNLKGMSGSLITPQEASTAYDRQQQDFSAQAVFFNASNYVSQVLTVPALVGQFYTNYQAYYREPDQVQISYVHFGISNYLAQSTSEWAKTNLEEVVNAYYSQRASDFADAKSPEEAKSRIRELLIRQRAAADAKQQATEFASPLFAMDPPKAENLAVVAKQKGLTVQTTAPFSAQNGPFEFNAPPAFIKIAFELNSDTPYAGPVEGTDGFYVIALARAIPSYIPAFELIGDRVRADFTMQQSLALAQRAGTNFYAQVSAQLAAGKTFDQAAAAAGYVAQALPPFSLGTQDLPEFGGQNELNALKQTAFSTPVGHVSNFVPSRNGGFVLYVKAMLPVDAAKKATDLPEFIAQLRRERISEAFNVWLQGEANREFRNIPSLQAPAAPAAK